MTFARVIVLPEPVTPSRVWYLSPRTRPLVRSAMARGWSPAGWNGAMTSKAGLGIGGEYTAFGVCSGALFACAVPDRGVWSFTEGHSHASTPHVRSACCVPVRRRRPLCHPRSPGRGWNGDRLPRERPPPQPRGRRQGTATRIRRRARLRALPPRDQLRRGAEPPAHRSALRLRRRP